jgi:hypothetical protein
MRLRGTRNGERPTAKDEDRFLAHVLSRSPAKLKAESPLPLHESPDEDPAIVIKWNPAAVNFAIHHNVNGSGGPAGAPPGGVHPVAFAAALLALPAPVDQAQLERALTRQIPLAQGGGGPGRLVLSRRGASVIGYATGVDLQSRTNWVAAYLTAMTFTATLVAAPRLAEEVLQITIAPRQALHYQPINNLF